MSKQSEEKLNQGYNEKPIPRTCANCRNYSSELITHKHAFGEYMKEKNKRCGLGGFAESPLIFRTGLFILRCEMNTEQITTLQKLLSEIDNSMSRADAEKDLQAEITLRAARECGVDKKDFAALAKAHHKGDMHIARQRCIDQADLLELIIGEDEYPVLREFRRIDAETRAAKSILSGIQ